MFALDTILAVALLAVPPEAKVDRGLAERSASLCPILQQVAISWEIMDRRELRYVLTRKEDFESDLQLLRKRFRDLKNAPPLHDCVRFPPRKVVSQLLSFNRDYQKHLKERLAVDPTNRWLYREALTETDRLYKIWDTIRDTRCEYYYVTVRRQALKKVIELIGEGAFYNGNYPPHIPIWRFRLID